MLLTGMALLFDSCNVFKGKDDYNYLQNNMYKNKNIIAVGKDMAALDSIYPRLKAELTKAGLLIVGDSTANDKLANLMSAVKHSSSVEQSKQLFIAAGISDPTASLFLSTSADISSNLKTFKSDYPNFATYSKSDQSALLTNALNTIRGVSNNSQIFRKIQEVHKTPGDKCKDAHDAALAKSTSDFYSNVARDAIADWDDPILGAADLIKDIALRAAADRKSCLTYAHCLEAVYAASGIIVDLTGACD